MRTPRLPPFDPDRRRALVVEAALCGGAGAVRIASAVADETTRDRLAASLRRGDLATWPYDHAYAARAADPRALLAEARSVVCLAFPYSAPAPGHDDALRGRVSKYAWSRDYHRRVGEMLAGIARRIDELFGRSVTALACDTKPLAERALAARSGLGWIGKHTNLIAPGLGSFVFLGEIVTSLQLPIDPPLRTHCGTCRRCIDLCPTGALRGDYTIDATRCIADLTQRTDAIPRELRARMGTWVWGCDLCQEVCPPTGRAPQAGDPSNAPLDAEAAAPSLRALLRLRSGEFKRRYAKTAMGWRGAAVLRRNAAVALGNTMDPSAVPELLAALECDPHPMVRGHVAWALGRIGSPSALAALAARAEREGDPGVLGEIRLALEPFAPASRLDA
ncbi:MAG: tRNA epoxyqueuosine(34) reductase QueG [Vulcanimicrobiaceae bacterium]